ncbi:MAG: hypothetical protein ACKO23_03925 [Gemmataceae bacterium]
MYTALLLFTLHGSGMAPSAGVPEDLVCQTQYGTARAMGRSQGKPIAIIVGNGSAGWNQLVEEGSLSRRARNLLSQQFVPLYVNRDSEEGKRLVSSLDIHSETGIILSTREGSDQAFSHSGKMSRAELEETLDRFATVRSISRTETLQRQRYTLEGIPDASMRLVSTSSPVHLADNKVQTLSSNVVPAAAYIQPSQSIMPVAAVSSPIGQPIQNLSYSPAAMNAPMAFSAPAPMAPAPVYAAPTASYPSFGGYSGGFSRGYSSGGC